jgi:4-carboxymuconolactone decarboxylase
LIYDFATQLNQTRRISDQIYEQALKRFGHRVVVNLTGLLGYYTLVAMTLNVFEIRANTQIELPFPE